MHTNTSANQVQSANDYTFEPYDSVRETRAWYEKFLREHNGRDWERKLPFSLTDMVTGNLPTGPNGEKVQIFWYRIKHKGVLIGYADAKIHPLFNGHTVISDVWIIPEFRHRGHFHRSFPALVEHTKAAGVCLLMNRYRLYGGWFESFGFEWLFAFGSDPAEENPLTFLTTKDAYKAMIRYLIKHAGGHFCPATEKGRKMLEEVTSELERETLEGARAGART
jgi:hypothetical protein